jgi:glycosyltransferase involved in cell wall biosynthesis
VALTGKKILMIVENLPVPFDRRVWQEANTLKNNGAEITIICPKGDKESSKFEVIHGIKIYRHPVPIEGNSALGFAFEYAISLYWEFVLAIRIYFSERFQAIHACNPPDLIFLVALPFKLFGVKFIFDHHDINPELYLAKFGKKNILYYLLVFLERMSFRFSDISIATNDSYKAIAVERGHLDPDNVFVVRSGPKPERLKIQPADQDLKHGKSILIGYVGVIGQQEGIDHLLDALSLLISNFNFQDFHCTICGSGPALKQMKEICNELGLNPYVNFTGRIPDKELLCILNTADICVNPDVWNEMNDKSTMNKIMEYMALGKPIVQYDLKEGKYSAEQASLYAEANNREDFAAKILLLIKNPDLRKKMGDFGRQRINKHLQWKYEESKLVNAYQRVFKNSKPH